MVLSNKKLKRQFRSLLAESLAATESKDLQKDAAAPGDVNERLQSVRQLLVSKSQRPRSSKRANRRKKPPFPEDSKHVEGIETQKELNEKEMRKRKRNSDGDQEPEENKEEKKQMKKKEKKKKKTMEMSKDEKEGKKNEKGNGCINEEASEKGVAESIKIDKSEQNPKKDKNKEKKKTKEMPKDEKEGKKNEKENVSINEEASFKGVAESIKIDESEQNPKKVYVGGIPYYSTEDDIRSFFEGCGTITEVDCMSFPESGKFRGIAILTFKTEAAAKRALALDGADMGGFYLKIQPYKASRTQKSDYAPEIVDGYYRIYIGNLSWDITEDDLRKVFSECKISSIRFGTDKETGDFKGYAHVDFSDSDSLTIALKLDQKVVCGRPARIRCAVPKKAAETNPSSKPSVKKAEDGTSAGNSKKRRTCYECGIPGHLSSACPRKTAVKVNGSEAAEANSSSKLAAKKTEDSTSVGNSKKSARNSKRRTCYECGVPGHLASACPRRRAAEVDSSGGNS